LPSALSIARTGTPLLGTSSVPSAFLIGNAISAPSSVWLYLSGTGAVGIVTAWATLVLLVVLVQETPQRWIGGGRLDNRPLWRISLALALFAALSGVYGMLFTFPIVGVLVAAVHISRSGSRIWRPAIGLTAAFTLVTETAVHLGLADTPLTLTAEHASAVVSLIFAAIGIANLGLAVRDSEVAVHQQRMAEQRFRVLVQSSSDAVTLLDAGARFSYASPACSAVLALDSDDLLGTRPDELVSPEDAADTADRIRSLLEGSAGPDACGMRWEVGGDQAAGRPRWLEFSARSLLDDGQPGVLLTLRDVSERRAAQDELSYAATHDHLTGLKTRREFLRLASLSTAGAGARHAVAILFCDLDGFKGVNDVYGHAAGDEVLRAISARLRRALRPEEPVGRLGGDEFGVLLPGPLDEQEATLVADRLQAAISPAITLRGGGAVRLGMSIGVYLVKEATPDAETVLPQADRAMYAMKSNNRLSVLLDQN
jgi:diguanylate cyclase (GGDEF)-like protein/PAS domain S-box-containing protein